MAVQVNKRQSNLSVGHKSNARRGHNAKLANKQKAEMGLLVTFFGNVNQED